jgi:hypothetical protein
VALCRPVTVIGDEEPVPVYPPGLEVTVKEVANPPGPVVKETSALPSLKARPEPTFVADTDIGVPGAPLADDETIPSTGI